MKLTFHALAITACCLATAVAQSTNYEIYSNTDVTDALSAMDPPYTTLINVDYTSEKQAGDAPRQQFRDIHNGGITVTDAIDCAKECNKRTSCNMASYYGEVANWTDSRNCWLKELQQLPCSFPADLQKHSDNRLLLLARPPSQCSGQPFDAPPLPPRPAAAPKKNLKAPNPISPPGSNQPPPDSTDPVQKETIKTDEQKQTILGTRKMDPSVAQAYEIENSANAALPMKWHTGIIVAFALAVHVIMV